MLMAMLDLFGFVLLQLALASQILILLISFASSGEINVQFTQG
jgi:hypothetical protein